MYKVELKILGQPWTVFLLEEEAFIKRCGDRDAAITYGKSREIVFNEAELSRNTVWHELFHGFLSEMCITSAGLSADQFEEVAAELFGEHGDKIIRLGRKLYKELRDYNG